MKTSLLVLFVAAAGIYYSFHSAPPTAPVAHLANEGTYYLLSYYSTASSNGLIGWVPGQEVRVDRSKETKTGFVAVTDGKYSAYLRSSLLTQDMDLAEAVRASDQAAQAQGEALQAQARNAGNAQQLAESMTTAAHVEAANAAQVASSAIGTLNSRLRNGAYHSTDTYGYASSYTIVEVPQASGGGSIVTSGKASSAGTAALSTPYSPRLTTATATVARYAGDHYAGTGPSTSAPARPATPVPAKPTMSVPVTATTASGTASSTGPGYIAR